MRTSNKSIDTLPVLQHASSPVVLNTKQGIATLKRDSTELQLIKLLQQHRHTKGWILLVAPEIKPNKAFWAACQLPLDKILVVHQKYIKHITAVLHRAICTKGCHVVINCAPLEEAELSLLTEQAKNKGNRFYTLHQALNATH